MEAPNGEDPDKSDYIVSNEKFEKSGFEPKHSLEEGVAELIKGYTMIKNTIYTNIWVIVFLLDLGLNKTVHFLQPHTAELHRRR